MHERMPIVVVAGVDEASLAMTSMHLTCDATGWRSLSYLLDVERDELIRTVGDLTGHRRTRRRIGHLCPGCLIREDVLPELLALADGGCAYTLLQLPPGLEPAHLLWAISNELLDGVALADRVRVASVVAAVQGRTAVADLLGDTLLTERGVSTSAQETRGLGETLARIVEAADLVALDTDAGAAEAEEAAPAAAPTRREPDTELVAARDLVRALMRPGGEVLELPDLAVTRLLDGEIDVEHVLDWLDPSHEFVPAPMITREAWVLRLESWLPFHPSRLLAEIERLAAGPFRARGCFWLPSRPGVILTWDGAGGQLSIGEGGSWAGEDPVTRLTITGVGPRAATREMERAFARALLSPREVRLGPRIWRGGSDGLEPWLGAIGDADVA